MTGLYGNPHLLYSYSTQQLIEELARRANAVPTKKPRHWCHDCKNFVAWCDKKPPPRIDCPDDYNPCTKGHEMKFMVPQGYDDDYGFYLPVCSDRELLETSG